MVEPRELASVALFQALPTEALTRLAAASRVRSFAAGERVFAEGELDASLHIVRRGSLEVRHPSRPGVVLHVVAAGASVGELALIDGAPRSAEAVAREPTVTIQISKDDLDPIFAESTPALLGALSAISRHLTAAKEEIREHNEVLEQRVAARTAYLYETQLEVIRRLARAAELRDRDTGDHIERMSELSLAMANAIGMSDHECELIFHATPMHDVGKVGIPDSVLLKPGKLTPEEWHIMQSHTTIGAKLLSGSRSEVVQLAERIALMHHEKWDGSGYPNALTEEEIPIEARICTICDVYDALVSARPYKEAWTSGDALTEIERLSGTAFDPSLVPVFLDLVGSSLKHAT